MEHVVLWRQILPRGDTLRPHPNAVKVGGDLWAGDLNPGEGEEAPWECIRAHRTLERLLLPATKTTTPIVQVKVLGGPSAFSEVRSPWGIVSRRR